MFANREYNPHCMNLCMGWRILIIRKTKEKFDKLELAGHFFLDGDDEQVAVEQRGHGRLLVRGVHAAADFAARAGLARNVSK